MRVVLVSPYDLAVPGGVQSHVLQLADRLRSLGDEVLVFGPGRGATSEPRWTGLGRSAKVPANGSRAPVALGPPAFARTREALTRLRPDVIHVHEPLVPVVGLAAATSAVAPVVATHHAWAARARAYRVVGPLGRRLTARIATRLAVSTAAAAFHAQALGLPSEAFQVVPNGIDVERFSRPSTPPPGAPVADPTRATVLFVGRLEPRKGAQVLLAAMRRCWRSGREVRALVVGDGPQRAALADQLAPEERDRFVLLGRVDHATLRACHAAADVFVSPALGGESFGIVLLEAMAAGTPVLASDLPGYRTVVESGKDGLLVAPGDAAVLADALGALLDDPTRRDQLQAAGHLTVQRYDWSHVAAEVRSVYDRLHHR